MEWPKVETTGKVSTTVVNKRIWKAFLSPLVINKSSSSASTDNDAASAIRWKVYDDALEVTKALEDLPDREWRHRYTQFVNTIIQIQVRATPEEALEMCQAGLEAAHENMNFAISSSTLPTMVSAKEAVLLRDDDDDDDDFFLDSLVIYGQGKRSDEEKKGHMAWRVPASTDDPTVFQTLHGEAVTRQLQALAAYGAMEPSAASSAAQVMTQKTVGEISESLKDKVFVLLGATSELGPARTLAYLGTTIVAIARSGHKLLSLMQEIRDTTDSTLILPIKRPKHTDEQSTINNSEDEEAHAGADLIHDTPQLARWIANLYPQKQLVIVPLAYLDGEANVRAVVAMDLIIEYVLQHRDSKRRSATCSDAISATTALAFLISPGTPHVITEEAAMDARRRYTSSQSTFKPPVWQTALRFLPTAVGGFAKYCITDSPLPPHDLYVFNGLADIQGPNYALSKCIQQWRAMLAHSRGHCISANISPPAKTQSMVGHDQVATWLNGIQAFPPMVVFDPSMARTLMTSLLVWDLICKKHITYHHPTMLFMENSVHGGVWRFPYDINSVGLVSFMIGKFMPSMGYPPKEIVLTEEDNDND